METVGCGQPVFLFIPMKTFENIPIKCLIFVRNGFIMESNYDWEVSDLGEILALLSGKGGTGKTSVCAGIAQALAQSGQRVLCIDCDVGLRNLDISLGMSECAGLSFLDVCSGAYPLEQAAKHPMFPSLFFLTAPMNCRADQIDPSAFRVMLRNARDAFDFILLDAPAGVEVGFHLAADNADRFLVVTGFGPAAVRDASRVGDLLELAGRQDVRLIVNRVDRGMLQATRKTIDDVMDTAGLPLLGVILEDPDITLAAAFGKPVLRHAPRGDAARAFRRIARRIQGYPEPMRLR